MNDTPPKSSAFLSPADLPRLKAQGLNVPAYARAGLTLGVVHLGLGAFHRAHQALVFDRLLASGVARWGVRGVCKATLQPISAALPMQLRHRLHLSPYARASRRSLSRRASRSSDSTQAGGHLGS